MELRHQGLRGRRTCPLAFWHNTAAGKQPAARASIMAMGKAQGADSSPRLPEATAVVVRLGCYYSTENTPISATSLGLLTVNRNVSSRRVPSAKRMIRTLPATSRGRPEKNVTLIVNGPSLAA